MKQQLVAQHWTNRIRNLVHAATTALGGLMIVAYAVETQVDKFTHTTSDWRLAAIGSGIVTASQVVDSTSFTKITSAAVSAWATFSSGGQVAPDAVLLPSGQAIPLPSGVDTSALSSAPQPVPPADAAPAGSTQMQPTAADIRRSAPLPSSPALPPGTLDSNS